MYLCGLESKLTISAFWFVLINSCGSGRMFSVFGTGFDFVTFRQLENVTKVVVEAWLLSSEDSIDKTEQKYGWVCYINMFFVVKFKFIYVLWVKLCVIGANWEYTLRQI